MGRNLPLIKSTTSIYNRAAPKNKRSRQAKNHLGKGLFCCKKPPKAESTSNLLTHFCRAHKKNIVRTLCGQENKELTLFRSFDDKAYLCPETSTGMQSARSQKVYRPSEDSDARKFKHYDFPKSMLNCTPGTFLYMEKNVEMAAETELIKTAQQDAVVLVKPKYFVGSSGSVWGSHLMSNRHKEPLLHACDNDSSNVNSTVMKGWIVKGRDCLESFKDQSVTEDLIMMKEGENPHRQYEKDKLIFLQKWCEELTKEYHDFTNLSEVDFETGNSLLAQLNIVLLSASSLYQTVSNADNTGESLVSQFSKMLEEVDTCLEISRNKQPSYKPRIVDLTDAGPGVGITNHEVSFRIAQEIRICKYDFYIRHHLAPGDSSQNEVERIQSAVG